MATPEMKSLNGTDNGMMWYSINAANAYAVMIMKKAGISNEILASLFIIVRLLRKVCRGSDYIYMGEKSSTDTKTRTNKQKKCHWA
jgi:hypothetical protein